MKNKMRSLVLLLVSCCFCICVGAQTEETVSKTFSFFIDPNVESPTEFMQKYVLDSVQLWQKKGRYETTAEYKARVTEDNRNIFAGKLAKNAEKAYLQKYYLNNTLTFTLEDYDADNESFLLSNPKFGKIVLPVPRREAEIFEKCWRVDNADVELFVDGNKVKIKKIPFISQSKVYLYDNSQSAVFAATKTNVQLPSLVLDLTAEEQNEGQQQILERNITVGKSDVDIDIPLSDAFNDNTFVVIIANEEYRREAPVPFALNDGRTFKDYCLKTLGIPKINIHFVENATLNDFRHEILWVKNVIETQNGDAKVIFYYAGHGIPDEASKKAYLLPVDGYAADFNTGYSLDELYQQLANYPTKQLTYFIDACFSGSKREAGMLASARAVSIRPKESVLEGNAVVFTASSNDQTAYPYYDKGHGMFTYFLLKKLKETSGNVSYQELGEYIGEQVSQKSVILNSKLQSPSIKANPVLQDSWKKWTLK